MADENEIDTDDMSLEQLSEMKGKMVEGEDVSAPVAETQPEPTPGPEDEEAALAAAEAEPPAESDKGSKTVPHKTFHYANERRKAAEKEAAEARERFVRLEARTQALLEAQAPKAEEQKPEVNDIPDDADPVAIINWAKREILARKQADADHSAQQETQTKEQAEFQQVFDRVNEDYTRAIAADTSVVDAHNALRRAVAEELTEVYGYTQQQALQELTRQENQHLINIANSGQNVGDYIKKLAKARGWRPEPPKTEETAATGNDKLDKARQAGASLGTSGGAVANSGKITPEMLADMPEAEFQEYMKKHGSTRAAFAA